jgi:integrase
MIGTVRVEFKASKIGAWGKSPISMIYSVNGDRTRYSPQITIYGIYWDKGNQRLQFIPVREAKRLLPDAPPNKLLSDAECKSVNNILNRFESDIHDAEVRFIANGVQFTSRMVVDAVLGGKIEVSIKEEPKELLFDFMETYIKKNNSVLKDGSLSVYRSTLEHLRAYQAETKDPVRFDTIDKEFFHRFYMFLLKRTKTNKADVTTPLLSNVTMKKITGTLTKFLREARVGKIKVNDFSGFSIKVKAMEVIALTMAELKILLDLDLSNNLKLDRVRDIFCFSCCTGMRFSDIVNLDKESIHGDLIEIVMIKTEKEVKIPLTPISLGILKKYEGGEHPLPRISNQKANDYLTEICKKAGFDEEKNKVRFRGAERVSTIHPRYERITFHTGRKTFCTLSIELGMREVDVMKISGHTDFRSFQRYINTTTERAIKVMSDTWGELS